MGQVEHHGSRALKAVWGPWYRPSYILYVAEEQLGGSGAQAVWGPKAKQWLLQQAWKEPSTMVTRTDVTWWPTGGGGVYRRECSLA